MGGLTLGTILKAALLAGLAAGLTVAIFHTIVTEPLIDRAIALEEERHAADTEHDPPIISRQTQKAGLVVGFLLYGVTWALLFGVTYHLAQRWLPVDGSRGQRLAMALAAYWAVGLLPFLKYPANPPGVGDPETIGYRQALYLGFLALSVVGTVLALAVSRRVGQAGNSGPSRWLLSFVILAALSLGIYLVMPSNPDPIEMPAEIMTSFRTLSLIGLTLFWTVLGLFFAMLLKAKPTATPRPA